MPTAGAASSKRWSLLNRYWSLLGPLAVSNRTAAPTCTDPAERVTKRLRDQIALAVHAVSIELLVVASPVARRKASSPAATRRRRNNESGRPGRPVGERRPGRECRHEALRQINPDTRVCDRILKHLMCSYMDRAPGPVKTVEWGCRSGHQVRQSRPSRRVKNACSNDLRILETSGQREACTQLPTVTLRRKINNRTSSLAPERAKYDLPHSS